MTSSGARVPRTSARPNGGQAARPHVGARPSPSTQPPRSDPAQSVPAQSVPAQSVPAQSVPAQSQPSFAELGVAAGLVAALAQRGVVVPFPIQAASLADSLAGRDVLGRGRTGSGKTVAFALPVVAKLTASARRPQSRRPRALVLLPTRELASQVAETLIPLAAVCRLRVATVFGGVGQHPQVTALRQGVDILVACPGRLEDLIGQGHCRLDAVEVTVLDEADHMADLGFLPAVKRLLDATPSDGQRLLFSATLDNGVDVLVRRYLTSPVTHSVDEPGDALPAMSHHVLQVSTEGKASVVRELASGRGRTLLFTRTKHGAKKLARTLTAAGVPAVDLHGNLSQPVRERHLASFSTGSVRVLVATDIAARGIHVDDITLVVHVDPPADHKAYLHRSGRTARAGSAGDVVTVMTSDQANDVRVLARRAGISPAITSVRPGDHQILALTGPHAPLVTAAPTTTQHGPEARRLEARRAGPKGGHGGREASIQSPRSHAPEQPGRRRPNRALNHRSGGTGRSSRRTRD